MSRTRILGPRLLQPPTQPSTTVGTSSDLGRRIPYWHSNNIEVDGDGILISLTFIAQETDDRKSILITPISGWDDITRAARTLIAKTVEEAYAAEERREELRRKEKESLEAALREERRRDDELHVELRLGLEVPQTDIMFKSFEIAQIEARIDQQIDSYQKRPRRRFIGTRTQEYRFARYIKDWRLKTERIGTLNYPQAARDQKIYGSLQMTVSIKSDGTVDSIEINRSSGQKVLDEAARRIVHLAAPYSAFPPDISKDTDVLSITDTWTFTRSAQLSQEEAFKQIDAQQAAAQTKQRNEYIERIRARIKRFIVLPPNLQGNPEVEIDVIQLQGGEVLSARLKRSSGISAYDSAVERAILKAQPLPSPLKPELFERELNLKFRPQE